MKLSIKQIQSECGAVGEPGRNLAMSANIAKNLAENFEHSHENETANDAVFFISQAFAGHEYKNEDAIVHSFALCMKGCRRDLHNMLVGLLMDQPEHIELFSNAVIEATIRRGSL